ncbi:hypothetical protein DFH08DRAFT_819203 [Mycena albidolilacea]|uniref:Uncharacterized protein n=1 Tax=Mycena albidolilacea TaxID=1033008 RepID=A0AAD6ZEF5_9AGAR|nr:hypothetical protein DFH08DRAFT_819203 [Mycena albidolilacea]
MWRGLSVRVAGNAHTGGEIEPTGSGYRVHMLQVLRVYAEAEAASNEGAGIEHGSGNKRTIESAMGQVLSTWAVAVDPRMGLGVADTRVKQRVVDIGRGSGSGTNERSDGQGGAETGRLCTEQTQAPAPGCGCGSADRRVGGGGGRQAKEDEWTALKKCGVAAVNQAQCPLRAIGAHGSAFMRMLDQGGLAAQAKPQDFEDNWG